MSGSRSGAQPQRGEHRTGEHMAKRTLDASERLHARARVQREAKRTNCTPATWRTNKPPSGGCVSGVVLGAFLAPSPYLDNRDNNSDL